jgi:hypothetical protein
MVVPAEVLQDLVNATNAQFNQNYYLYQVSCGVQFRWTIGIGGVDYVVDQSQGIIDIGRNQCFLAFEAVDTGYDFVLCKFLGLYEIYLTKLF